MHMKVTTQEKQNGWDQKVPLEIIQSNLPAQARVTDPPQATQGHIQSDFEYLQVEETILKQSNQTNPKLALIACDMLKLLSVADSQFYLYCFHIL